MVDYILEYTCITRDIAKCPLSVSISVRIKGVNVEKVNEVLVRPNELSDTGLRGREGFQYSIYPTLK